MILLLLLHYSNQPNNLCYYIGYDEKDKEKRQEEKIDVLLLVRICMHIVHIYFLKLNIL